MRMVYAIQCDVGDAAASNGGESDPKARMNSVTARVTEWIESKYRTEQRLDVHVTLDGEVARPCDNHELRGATAEVGDCELVTIDWRHPHEDRNDPRHSDDALQWHTAVTIGRAGNDVQFALVLRLSSLSFTVKPVTFSIGRPRVVDAIISSFQCGNGRNAISIAPRVLGADQVGAFVEDELLAPYRRLPFIVISPDVWTGAHFVNPDDLAKSVLGQANVIVLPDKWAAFKLTDCVGKTLSCYDGAVRMYWPGLARTDDAFSHPLYLRERIRFHADRGQPLSKHLFRFLTAIAVFRFAEGDATQRARAAIDRAKNAEIEKLRKNLTEGLLDPGEREAALQQAWDDIERLKTELVSKEETLSRKDEQIAKLSADLRDQKALWSEYGEYVEDAPAVEDASPRKLEHIDSVLSATKTAAGEFGSNLTFLESAFKAAGESPYQRPERVFQALEAASEVCREWRESLEKGASMGSWREAFKRRGFDYKDDISQTTRTKFGDEYTFVYEGQKRLFEKHITEGAKQPHKCFSIHMYRDESKRSLVIGHVGRHLTNTRT